jgi:2-dehydro-3-deoxyphosphooctonate aldolase (KDO 8-P synthase)
MEAGLKILDEVRRQTGLPVLTDVHDESQVAEVASVVDVLQTPAFLCRQTDFIHAVARSGKPVNIKKGQFLAPWDMKNVIDKARAAAVDAGLDPDRFLACERGVSFGYNNLIVDMLAIPEMKKLGAPVTIDATHAVQLPGADPRTGGASTGGRRDGVAIIAKSAVAAGADGVFLEFHTDPDKALCDAPSCLALSQAESLLSMLKALHEAVN